MYGCIQSSVYNMTADIYKQKTKQDAETFEIKRSWHLLENIPCMIVPIRESGGSATSDNKVFRSEYIEELEIKMYTSKRLSKRWRVAGIKNFNRESLYTEIDKVSDPDTVFEVFASHPIFDIFGNIQYFENHLKRTQVQ